MFSLESMTRLLELSLGCGAVIALLLALTPLLSRRLSPKWRYTAWLLLCLRLVFFGGSLLDFHPPFRAPVRLEVPQAVVQNAYDPREDYLRDQELARQGTSGSGFGGTTDLRGTYYRYYIRYEDESGRDVFIENDEFSRTVTVDGVSRRSIHWTAAAGLGWFLVAVSSYALSIGGYFRFRKRALGWSSPAGEADRAALETQLERQKVKDRPELYRCPLVHSPLLMGFHHPVVLLPEDLPAAALEAALAHEVRHLKRRDTGYLNLLILARSIHWFNPLVWVMVRRARQDAELCCDYDLLKDQAEDARRSYGQAILDQMTAGKREGPSLTTGFSGSKAEVFRRFRAIMDLSPKRWGRAALALAACATLLAGGLVACDRAAQPEELTASATLGEEAVQVPCTGDGSEPDLENLPVLTFPLENARPRDIPVKIQLPRAASGEVQLQLSQASLEEGELRREGSDALPADGEGCLTVYFQLLGAVGQEDAVFSLTWGEENQYRCAFKVEARYSASAKGFTGLMGGRNTYLVHGTINRDLTAVLYERIDWFGRDDEEAETIWWISHWEHGWLEELSAPLAPDAQLLHHYTCPLNPQTIEYSIQNAQDGALMEITLNDKGEVERLMLRGEVRLDLDAADLDFTGFSGEVYSQHRPAAGADGTVSFDPCSRFFQDKSDAWYTLPAGEYADLERLDRSPASGYYVLDLENGVVTSIGDFLDFSDAIDRWNDINQKDLPDVPLLTASLGVHREAGPHRDEPCYRFENAQLGILLEVFQSARYWEGDRGYDCLLSYGGRSEEFQLPNLPLAPFRYGHVAGECGFYLSDLTGDGVPELIFIDGYHQSGAGFDSCRVFDPAAMEEYKVVPEFEEMVSSLRLELAERKGEDVTCRLYGPGTAYSLVSVAVPEDMAWKDGVVLENCYSIVLNAERTALELHCTVQSACVPWANNLADVSGSFVFDPLEKAFRIQGPFSRVSEPLYSGSVMTQWHPILPDSGAARQD